MDALVTAGHIAADTARLALGWAVARQPKLAEGRSGDGYLIRRTGAHVMIAVTDGTGSGPEAADAADICLSAVGKTAGHSIRGCFDDCHAALRGSRGAALGVALVDLGAARVTWAAVGDIDGLLLCPRDRGEVRRHTIFQRGGTLGVLNPGIHPQCHQLAGGEVILMTTDGVSRRYRDSIRPVPPMRRIAADTLARFGKPNDDGLVLALGIELAS